MLIGPRDDCQKDFADRRVVAAAPEGARVRRLRLGKQRLSEPLGVEVDADDIPGRRHAAIDDLLELEQGVFDVGLGAPRLLPVLVLDPPAVAGGDLPFGRVQHPPEIALARLLDPEEEATSGGGRLQHPDGYVAKEAECDDAGRGGDRAKLVQAMVVHRAVP
jgi:hypothetical protein